MELVKVKAPVGAGEKMASLAFEQGIAQVSISKGEAVRADKSRMELDVLEFESNTQKSKEFVEALMLSSFYDPITFSFTTRHPESIFATERPEEETDPIVRPTTDVYEELWQFVKVTVSLVARVFISAFLVAYGMREDFMPLIIAGLLFLPYHHHLLGIALGAGIKEWRLLKQALLSFLISTLCIVAGGILMGLLTEPGIKFMKFAETPLLFSFIISAAIGIAAGFAALDDAGRRELIGLAATAHLTVYPVWFGMKFIYGFEPSDKPMEFLLVFLMDVVTIVVFTATTFKLMKMKGKGIQRFVKAKEAQKVEKS